MLSHEITAKAGKNKARKRVGRGRGTGGDDHRLRAGRGGRGGAALRLPGALAPAGHRGRLRRSRSLRVRSRGDRGALRSGANCVDDWPNGVLSTCPAGYGDI